LSPPLPSSLASIKPAEVHLEKWPLKRREREIGSTSETTGWKSGVLNLGLVNIPAGNMNLSRIISRKLDDGMRVVPKLFYV